MIARITPITRAQLVKWKLRVPADRLSVEVRFADGSAASAFSDQAYPLQGGPAAEQFVALYNLAHQDVEPEEDAPLPDL